MITPSLGKTVSSVCDRNGSSEGRLAGLGRCRRWRLRPRGALAEAGVHPVEIRRTKMLPYQKRIVRSLLTPPGRAPFKPIPLRACSNALICRAFDNRTKMAVVRLRQRKSAERGGKRPQMGLSAGPGVRIYDRKGPHSGGLRPAPRPGKRMSQMGRLAEGSTLAPNILLRGGAASGTCCRSTVERDHLGSYPSGRCMMAVGRPWRGGSHGGAAGLL